MHGNVGPNLNTNECDVLIAIGMRFDDRVTGNLATYAKQAKVIHFDIDPAEVNKNVKVDIAVLFGFEKRASGCCTGLLKKNRHTEWVDSFKEYEAVEEEKVIGPGSSCNGFTEYGRSGACGKRSDPSRSYW